MHVNYLYLLRISEWNNEKSCSAIPIAILATHFIAKMQGCKIFYTCYLTLFFNMFLTC